MGILSGSLSTTAPAGLEGQARTLRGGASGPTARSRTPVINGDGSATFRLGLRLAQALAWHPSVLRHK